MGTQQLVPAAISSPFYDRLDALKTLAQGWDSHSAPAPSTTAIESAKALVNEAGALDTTPERVEPSAMGGVGVTFSAAGREVVIEFYNNGTARALFSDETTGNMYTQAVSTDATACHGIIGEVRKYLYGEKPQLSQPDQILRAALERYRKPDGYEGYLVDAAWQLEEIGAEAWPVLHELVLTGTQECEYFLGAVVRMKDVAPQHRLTTLLAAARNPDANVRSRLLELLEEMPGDLRRAVWRELTATNRSNEMVPDRASNAGNEQAS